MLHHSQERVPIGCEEYINKVTPQQRYTTVYVHYSGEETLHHYPLKQ